MEALDPLVKNCVTVTGKPDAARTIVFVHGLGTDQTAWADVAAAFKDDFRIVLFDNAGAGRSIPEAFVQHRYLNLRTYAKDLIEICEALAVRDAIVVGHSAGAMIGVLAAIEAPLHFSKLVLIGASPRYLNDAESGYRGGFSDTDLKEIYRAVALNFPEWADRYAPMAMGNPGRPSLARHFAEGLKAIPHRHALTVLCSIFQSDHRADLPKLAKPTLLLQTQADLAVPMEVAEYLHREIRGSRLAVVEATGHFPHLSAPDAVITAMRDFVREP